MADVGLIEAKRFVIASNNERNRKLGDVLGVRITTADKPDLPSIVLFRSGELERGSPASAVVGDDIVPIPKRDLVRQVGALTQAQMEKVGEAMKEALALT